MNNLSELEARFVGRLMAISQHGAKGGAAIVARLRALEEISAEADRVLGSNSPVSLRIRLSLEDHLSDDRDARASLLAFRLLDERCLGSLLLTDPVSMAVRAQMAKIMRKAGDVDGGIELYRKEIALRERYLGEESYRSSMARQNLAVALSDRGSREDFAEAEKISRSELQLRQSKWGAEHPFVWVSQMNVANALVKRVELYPEGATVDVARAEEALALAASVAVRRRARLGPGSAATIRADRTRARALLLTGKPEVAVWTLRRLVAMERFGTREPGSTLVHLARALRASSEAGSGDESDRVAGEALEKVRKTYGAASPQVAAAKALLTTDPPDRGEGDEADVEEE